MKDSTPRHNPDAGYDAHEQSLENVSQLDITAEGQPDERDKRANRFNNNESGPGAGGRWDPEEEIDLSTDRAPGMATGVGLTAGPDGKITLEELRRRIQKKRSGRTIPDEISDEYARAVEAIKEGKDPEDVEPVDVRWV